MPNAIDVRVGRRIKKRRERLAMADSDLAKAVGVSVDDLRLHESGDLHIDAGLLLKFKKALNVDVSYFLSENEPNGFSA